MRDKRCLILNEGNMKKCRSKIMWVVLTLLCLIFTVATFVACNKNETVNYRIEVYYQNAERTNYVQDTDASLFLSGKVGDRVQASANDYLKSGFAFNEELSSQNDIFLTKGDNCIRLYFNRADYKFTYYGIGETVEQEVYNGQVVTLGDLGFSKENAVFLGWSDSISNGISKDNELGVGNRIEVSGNLNLYACWGDIFIEALQGEDRVAIAELASADGKRVALYGGKLGEYDEATSFFNVDGVKGKIDLERGVFLRDVSGKYLGYSLLSDKSEIANGTLALNFLDGTAEYTLGDETVSGNFEFCITGKGAYTGELRFYTADDEFYFCFMDENPELDDEYKGEFLRQGNEAGEYIIVDMTDGEFTTPYKYNAYLDGYGSIDFPVPKFMGLANVYGSYYGYNAERGEWKYVYEGQYWEDIFTYRKEFIFKVGYLNTGIGEYDFDNETLNGAIKDRIPILAIYEENLDGTFTASDGSVLEMNGYGDAVYTYSDGGEEVSLEGFVGFTGDMLSSDPENPEIATGIRFVYYDQNDDTCFIYFLAKRGEVSGNGEITGTIKEVKNNIGEAIGNWVLPHGENKHIELMLDGEGNATLYLAYENYGTRNWFASGTYTMSSKNDGLFTLGDATQSLAYMGVAAGSFNFRLEESEEDGRRFAVRDETLLGGFSADSKTIVFDGFGGIKIDGEDGKFEKLDGNTVKVIRENGEFEVYTLNFDNKTADMSLSENLVGDYLTVVYDNALYVGPGRLTFDGKGRGMFYEMAEGVYLGDGYYTYDKDTNRGRFTTVGDLQFYVESFDFCIARIKDADGIFQDVYIRYDKNADMTLTGADGDTLTLDGYGFATYLDKNGQETQSRYEIQTFERRGVGDVMTFIDDGKEMTFAVDLKRKTFTREDEFGYYYGIYYDAERDAYMLSSENILFVYGNKGGHTAEGQQKKLFNGKRATYEKVQGSDGEFIFTYNAAKTGKAENLVDVRIKLVKIPNFDEDGTQYYTQAFMVYDAAKIKRYIVADGRDELTVDGYGDVTYTDDFGNVTKVEFYNAVISDGEIALNIFDPEFEAPSKMMVFRVDDSNLQFSLIEDAGVYVRLKDEDFFYPMLNLTVTEDGEKVAVLFDGNQNVYAICTYEKVFDKMYEYTLTIEQVGASFDDIKHIVGTDTQFTVKLCYFENDMAAYSCYVVRDEKAFGEFQSDGKTYVLDGYGNVEEGGRHGTVERYDDEEGVSYFEMHFEESDDTEYFKVASDKTLETSKYLAYLEWIMG